jgi:hypothetical protein
VLAIPLQEPWSQSAPPPQQLWGQEQKGLPQQQQSSCLKTGEKCSPSAAAYIVCKQQQRCNFIHSYHGQQRGHAADLADVTAKHVVSAVPDAHTCVRASATSSSHAIQPENCHGQWAGAHVQVSQQGDAGHSVGVRSGADRVQAGIVIFVLYGRVDWPPGGLVWESNGALVEKIN